MSRNEFGPKLSRRHDVQINVKQRQIVSSLYWTNIPILFIFRFSLRGVAITTTKSKQSHQRQTDETHLDGHSISCEKKQKQQRQQKKKVSEALSICMCECPLRKSEINQNVNFQHIGVTGHSDLGLRDWGDEISTCDNISD